MPREIIDARDNWSKMKPVFIEALDDMGINGVGYGFTLIDQDDKRYYQLVLSGGGDGAACILFHVYKDAMWLSSIEYSVLSNFRYRKHDITEDDFANELWEILTDSGETVRLWDELY